MSNVTIMYALPRSMTQWWRWFFAKGYHAVHDPLARCKHPNDLRKIVDLAEGEPLFIADTAAIFFHDRLEKMFPGHRRLYMLRNPYDVEASLLRQHRKADIRTQAALLWRHAYGADDSIRLHYGCVKVDTLRKLTGYGTEADLRTRIDVPLRAQYRDPANLKSLMAYKDSL